MNKKAVGSPALVLGHRKTSLKLIIVPVNSQTHCDSDQTDGIAVQPATNDFNAMNGVHKRRKSKKRKKKSSPGPVDSNFRRSYNGELNQFSCESKKKILKRPASFCENTLRPNSKVLCETPVHGKESKGNACAAVETNNNVVRRRVTRNKSFKKHRRGLIVDTGEEDNPSVTSLPKTALPEHSNTSSRLSMKKNPLSNQTVKQDLQQESNKKLKKQDALATINAFMVEVEEATNVAKQREKQGWKRNRDPRFRRSCSLNEFVMQGAVPGFYNPTNPLSNFRKPDILSSSKPFLRGHQKSRSIGQNSVASGSVFLSDADLSIEEGTPLSLSRRSLAKTISEEGFRSYDRSQSYADSAMHSDSDPATVMLSSRETRNRSDTHLHGHPPPDAGKQKDFDYGIAHLEQVCKLLEQIGDLRNQKQSLVKRVQQLEAQVKLLKEEKGSNTVGSGIPDSYQTLPNRNHPVGRLKNSMSSSRRSSLETSSHNLKGVSQPFMITNDYEETSCGGAIENDRRRSLYTAALTKKSKKTTYSRDDLDLSSKDRWKFWKGPTRNVDPQRLSKKQVISSFKAEHSQGSAMHLKSASVTLDSLLNNLDNNFSQKMLQWQSGERQRADSRSSDFNNRKPNFSKAVRGNKTTTRDKQGSSNTLNRFEKRADGKFSPNKRSRSFERMNMLEDTANDISYPARPFLAGADFHKSMPCVMTAVKESPLARRKRDSVRDSANSAVWSGLQEAFPATVPSSNKPLSRFLGGSSSRLTTPTRKKSRPSLKQRSWSFGRKSSPKTKPFLPKDNFTIGTEVERAEALAGKLTLELDKDDLKGVDPEDLDYLKKNRIEPKGRLNEIENMYQKPASKSKAQPPHGSSLARFHSDPNVRSYRRSKNVETLRLSSCEILSSPVRMSPLPEEVEVPLICRSLPDLRHIENMAPCHGLESDFTRRLTVTIVDLDEPRYRTGCLYGSAPSVFIPSASQTSSLKRRIKAKSPSLKSSEAQKRKDASKLLNGRSARNSFHFEPDFVSISSADTSSEQSQPKTKKKRSFLSGKIMNRFQRKSSKSHQGYDVAAAEIPKSPKAEKSPKTTKKKRNRLFSLKAKQTSPVKIVFSTEDGEPFEFQKDLKKSRKKSQSQPKRDDKKTYNSTTTKIDKHVEPKKTGDTSLDDSLSRSDSMPPNISKGIVSRLSKRFTRHEKESEEKKNGKSLEKHSRNSAFLDAKNRFESKTPSSNINNNNAIVKSCYFELRFLELQAHSMIFELR